MTTPILKIKVLAKPVIKGKMDVRFPGRVEAVSPILLDKTGGVFTFSLDIEALLELLTSATDQEISSGSVAAIKVESSTVRVNKTVGGPITLTLPPAISKIAPVLVSDWKGDAGTNNITINTSGGELIQGRSSWVIAADNGSVFLRPIPGVGYAI